MSNIRKQDFLMKYMVICHYKDSKRKQVKWIVDGDLRFLKPSNTFWAYEFPFLSIVMSHNLYYMLLKAFFKSSNLNQ
jgi:hypothetical protein